MMVNAIREQFPSRDGIALEVDRYLTKAYFLRLLDVRQVEASSCLGGKAYNHVQIDQLLLPKIAITRHLWQQEPEDRRGAGERGVRSGKGVGAWLETVLAVGDDLLGQGTGDLRKERTNLFDRGRVSTVLPGAVRDELVVDEVVECGLRRVGSLLSGLVEWAPDVLSDDLLGVLHRVPTAQPSTLEESPFFVRLEFNGESHGPSLSGQSRFAA
jgi:hypothetical protein